MKKMASFLLTLALLAAILSVFSVPAAASSVDGEMVKDGEIIIDEICYAVTAQGQRDAYVKEILDKSGADIKIKRTVEIPDTRGVFIISSEQRKAYIKSHDWTCTVTGIGDEAFRGCRMDTITIPRFIESIGKEAFFGCSNLCCVTIPAEVTYIGEGAFELCGTSSGGLTIIGYEGSEAERYAKANHIHFSPINDANATHLASGNIWIIIAITAAALGGVAALVIVKKKPALADGAEKESEE